MEEVLLRRAANALFADVEPARPLTKGPVGWLLGGPLAWFKRIAGGLWVGGTVTITTGHVQFEPNAMNVAVHSNARSFRIPYGDLRDVRVERAFGTDIVVLTTGESETRFRCFGASAAAKVIADAWRRA